MNPTHRDLIQIETRHVIRFELDPDIIKLLHDLLPNVGSLAPRVTALENTVSQLGDQLNQALDAAIGRVQHDVEALNAKVADLQSQVDQGLITPEERDGILAKLAGLDPTVDAVLPPPDAPPAAAAHAGRH